MHAFKAKSKCPLRLGHGLRRSEITQFAINQELQDSDLNGETPGRVIRHGIDDGRQAERVQQHDELISPGIGDFPGPIGDNPSIGAVCLPRISH